MSHMGISPAPTAGPAGPGRAWVADAEDVAAWADGAAIGAELVYARAEALPKDSATGEVARALHAQGAASLHLRREGGRISYLIRRVMQRGVAEPLAHEPFKLTGSDARVFRALADAADAGDPCPNNRALMRAAGLRSPQQASYRVHRLCILGRITRDFDGEGRRSVTIVGSGKRTGAAEA